LGKYTGSSITAADPKSFGLKHYKQEEWYAQFLWPIFKSRKEESELSSDGPVAGDEIPEISGIKYTVSPGQLNG
jgi:hypothetical protein